MCQSCASCSLDVLGWRNFHCHLRGSLNGQILSRRDSNGAASEKRVGAWITWTSFPLPKHRCLMRGTLEVRLETRARFQLCASTPSCSGWSQHPRTLAEIISGRLLSLLPWNCLGWLDHEHPRGELPPSAACWAHGFVLFRDSVLLSSRQRVAVESPCCILPSARAKKRFTFLKKAPTGSANSGPILPSFPTSLEPLREETFSLVRKSFPRDVRHPRKI